MNLFEKGTRKGYRFESGKGLLTIEDLWNLPLTGATSLDSVAVSIHKQIKGSDEVSFVAEVPKENVELKDKLEIVKHIIAYKLKMKKAAEKAAETKATKQKLLRLIDQKKDEKLSSMDVEDLERMLASMDS